MHPLFLRAALAKVDLLKKALQDLLALAM